MNKLTKIGFTALAGSLIAVSAHAGSMSVSGSASISFSDSDTDNASGSAAEANQWSMGDSITMTGSGDILDDDDADVGDKPLKAMCVAVSANVDLAGQQAHGPCRFNAINEDNEAADWGLDPWFDGTNYVGAFVPGSTKTSNWALEEADGGWTLTGSIFDSASGTWVLPMFFRYI